MLTLRIDASAWRQHLKSVCASTPGIVPVTKGNGYGFGNDLLAAEAANLGLDTIAVGSLAEATQVAKQWEFSRILVLTPWHARRLTAAWPEAFVHSTASIDGLQALRGQRVVVECMTSLRRHGLRPEELVQAAALVDDVHLDGWALTMPIDRHGLDASDEAARWVETLRGAGLPVSTIYVTHLAAAELKSVSARFPEVYFRPRVGTSLWLGERSALSARSQVLDVIKVRRGQRFGYRQRQAKSSGYVLVAGGGTAHGIGLAAPKAVGGAAKRVRALGLGALAAVNRTRSPFRWRARPLWFAEPPHMQVSLLWLPANGAVPAPGDELDVDVRMTTTRFDRVELTE